MNNTAPEKFDPYRQHVDAIYADITNRKKTKVDRHLRAYLRDGILKLEALRANGTSHGFFRCMAEYAIDDLHRAYGKTKNQDTQIVIGRFELKYKNVLKHLNRKPKFTHKVKPPKQPYNHYVPNSRRAGAKTAMPIYKRIISISMMPRMNLRIALFEAILNFEKLKKEPSVDNILDAKESYKALIDIFPANMRAASAKVIRQFQSEYVQEIDNLYDGPPPDNIRASRTLRTTRVKHQEDDSFVTDEYGDSVPVALPPYKYAETPALTPDEINELIEAEVDAELNGSDDEPHYSFQQPSTSNAEKAISTIWAVPLDDLSNHKQEPLFNLFLLAAEACEDLENGGAYMSRASLTRATRYAFNKLHDAVTNSNNEESAERLKQFQSLYKNQLSHLTA